MNVSPFSSNKPQGKFVVRGADPPHRPTSVYVHSWIQFTATELSVETSRKVKIQTHTHAHYTSHKHTHLFPGVTWGRNQNDRGSKKKKKNTLSSQLHESALCRRPSGPTSLRLVSEGGGGGIDRTLGWRETPGTELARWSNVLPPEVAVSPLDARAHTHMGS